MPVTPPFSYLSSLADTAADIKEAAEMYSQITYLKGEMAMAVWRLQTSTSKGDISEYCLKNNIAAVGWSLFDYPNRNELSELSFDEYYDLADLYYNSFDSVVRFVCDIKENDLIWIRSGGIYYLGRFTSESKWRFCPDEDASTRDACNQISNIFWIKIGDESDIPGALSTSFIRGSTFQRIHKPGILEYSELIYNQKSNDAFKYQRTMEFNESTFYSLISPSDCEDLLYMWLYAKSEKEYVCIPSTNKLATEKYEFVILDAKTGKHIYVQVKNGDTPLNADNYADLIANSNNEVYLLTTRGTVSNTENYKNIHRVDPTELFAFVCDENNVNIIPPNIKYWVEFAYTNSETSGVKGIMFDTNDEDSEKYMFEHRTVAAWGSPKRYVDSFSKGDFVFYYKKWYGVIAVGKIVSDSPRIIDNGKELDVEMIIEPEYKEDTIYSVRPKEIKTLLKKTFFFASTRKVPFLNVSECNQLCQLLKTKISE